MNSGLRQDNEHLQTHKERKTNSCNGTEISTYAIVGSRCVAIVLVINPDDLPSRTSMHKIAVLGSNSRTCFAKPSSEKPSSNSVGLKIKTITSI